MATQFPVETDQPRIQVSLPVGRHTLELVVEDSAGLRSAPDTVTITVVRRIEPTIEPTIRPTIIPTFEPTILPTIRPTLEPTILPTIRPTIVPTILPTFEPTIRPTLEPTILPTIRPTIVPTILPTIEPTILPTIRPTVGPIIDVAPTISPDIPIIIPRGAAERPVADVKGIGPAFSKRLEKKGITNLAKLASMEPRRLAKVLEISEVRAMTFIDEARRLLRG